ncbi:hypothetical protein [Thermoanaerobacterium sp. RBIITD]|uniref:hypothetical protein n=1 Tax=Thermoanaerobacterium sp. RBIITD TaxID=1550240 RepID=UPI000BB7EAF8|nr:hypothetical protein [Thermoanaerobacterium sp. RBIITD]SNX54185.1 hypothetical protein SAMN05660242_1821 [Thermoanaerobacterium sp. RBIITD]
MKTTILCLGEVHEIGINKKGQLIFYNHTKEELKAEGALEKLGGTPCKCYMILQNWRNGGDLPTELLIEYDKTEAKRIQRYIKRRKQENANLCN